MRNLKLTMQYDGSRYKGWQRLGSSDMTIQERIENVLIKMTGEKIELIGSGRTDAGVHALQQAANFKTKDQRAVKEIITYLNAYLPEDIVIKRVEEVNERFHARYNAVSKTYMYRIWNHSYSNPFLRKHIVHIQEELNLVAMKQAACFLIGEHDFTSFRASKSKKKSNIRTIYSIEIHKNETIIEMTVHGSGFLHNMVRIIVGTLLEVGRGKMKPETVKYILDQRDRSLAGATAPAKGLFLYTIEY